MRWSLRISGKPTSRTALLSPSSCTGSRHAMTRRRVNLGRYRKYILDRFGLPDNIYNFLNQTGLPDRFITWRSPDEEMEDKNKQSCSGVFFTLRCLRTEKIKKRDFFVIGEDWSMGRCSEVCGDEWTWWKEEECTCIVADISTGEIWQWFHYTDTDFLAYINSSLEQYLLSMAYWRAFYPLLAQKTSEFTAKNPEETELDYIFKHHKTLYTPFWERIKAYKSSFDYRHINTWLDFCCNWQ